MLPIALALLGALFLLTTTLYLSRSPSARALLKTRLRLPRTRSFTAYTPPRSLSPAKQGLPPNNPPKSPNYSTTFPPSRREALALLSPDALSGDGPSPQKLAAKEPDYSKLVPSSEICDTEDLADHVTATGFSVREIKRLGDFPDYAALSGVPLPQPCEGFNIDTAKPRPYRPFRWAYHQTMSITKLEPDYWLELESNYRSRITQRLALYATHGPAVLQALPGSEIAVKELMQMSLQFLCARYPSYFSLTPCHPSTPTTFHNAILNTTTDLTTTHPLNVLLENVPEDFALMLRHPVTGAYTFRAGIICSSLGWSLGSKIGLSLPEIHAPIPDYREKMQFSMDRYFAKKPTDKAIQRGSWGLEVEEPLFMPPGDAHEVLRESQNPEHKIEDLNLRVDWQTLRRLPLSGSVVFNFKALFTPLTEFRHEPYIPALCLKVLKEGKRELMEYKGTWHVEHVVVPALEEWKVEQEREGVVEQGWEEHTLEETPFFPGWEEKWHRAQGF